MQEVFGMKFEIRGRKISGPELLGMLEDCDSETEWDVRELDKNGM